MHDLSRGVRREREKKKADRVLVRTEEEKEGVWKKTEELENRGGEGERDVCK